MIYIRFIIITLLFLSNKNSQNLSAQNLQIGIGAADRYCKNCKSADLNLSLTLEYDFKINHSFRIFFIRYNYQDEARMIDWNNPVGLDYKLLLNQLSIEYTFKPINFHNFQMGLTGGVIYNFSNSQEGYIGGIFEGNYWDEVYYNINSLKGFGISSGLYLSYGKNGKKVLITPSLKNLHYTEKNLNPVLRKRPSWIFGIAMYFIKAI